MFSEFLRLLRYFAPRLLGFGLVLGALFGALTYPILGGFVGAPWGLGAGLLMSIVMSIFIPVYEKRFAPEDEESKQSQMVLMGGLVTTIVMAIPLLILYAPIAGLTAAYLVKGYTDSAEYTGEKRKSSSADPYQRRNRVFSKVTGEMMRQANWVIALGTVIGTLAVILISIGNPFTALSSELLAIPFVAVLGIAYGYLVALVVASVNGLFVNFMNRLYFNEDTPKELYKRRIVPMVALLSLFTSAIVSFGIGAPFASIAAGLAASKYADWYYEDEGEEKAKRGSRLEERFEGEDEDLEADEDAQDLRHSG
jgi:hypothetical protein